MKYLQKSLLILILISLSIPQIQAATYTISENTEQDALAYNSQRNLARTSDGTLHITYLKQIDTIFHIFYAYSIDQGVTWIEEQVSNPPEEYSQYYPSIAVDSQDNIHIVWGGYGWGYEYYANNILYREKTSQGWQPTIMITDIEYYNYEPAIAVDSQDNIHVTWYGDGFGTNTNNYNIQYRKKTNTGWQPIESVTDIEYDQYHPSIAIDTQDNIHIAWEGQGWDTTPFNYDIQYIMKNQSGWQTPERVTDSPSHQSYPCIAVNQQDNIHVVWEGSGGPTPYITNIRYRMRNQIGWHPQENITNSDYDQFYATVALDAQDNIHIAWESARNPNQRTIQYIKKTIEGWQPNITLIESDVNNRIPSLLWAMWPDPPMVRTNVPETGYALAYTSGDSETGYDLIYHPSHNLTWGIKPEPITVGGELTQNNQSLITTTILATTILILTSIIYSNKK